MSFIDQFSGMLRNYAARLMAFHPNARLYLISVVLTGAAMGIFRLLFNFYVLSLGYEQAILGNLITTSSLTSLVLALPIGYLVDILGRKASLLLGGVLAALAVAGMVFWPGVGMFIGMNMLIGAAQALTGVTSGPFLMENSGEKERTYLFSFSSGISMASAFFGNWLGGSMPGWIGARVGAAPTSSLAYGSALFVVAVVALLGMLPLLFLTNPRLSREERSIFAPFAFLARKPGLLGRLILPMLVTSIGAGLFMPFMNVFFRSVHHQPDPVIGTLFAWGSLAMGIGLLVAPPLADRFGKVQLVVITQGISIPFLFALGYSPWFAVSAMAYYVRLALMNMSGPVYQTMVMERVEPSARGMVASLVSMAGSFGWAFSPTISGWLQEHYGFGPVFGLVLVLYVASVIMYWAFFWRTGPGPQPGEEARAPVVPARGG